ncbi:hypothetical protein [Pedobacter sp. B4-66]|uniref:hypothetical protein n=1 Tax=Pedobacter sp. B4-66 TaxID=2817280 RepID=UPI001BD9FBF4|nr:hypothetical protein [Pedobacter sp. B4-66]
MKNYLLIPSKYKVIGWIVFLLFTGVYIYGTLIYPKSHEDMNFEIPGFTWNYIERFKWANTNLTMVVLTSGILIGLLAISFSREKDEDEYISLLRLRSWQWAVLISYGILFLVNLFVYGDAFWAFMVYNMLTVLIVFIVKFYYSLYRLRKERSEDEK